MTVIVLAARDPLLAHVRGRLRDWAALGLVQQYLWLEAPATPQSNLGYATAVDISGARRVRVDSFLASQEDEKVRLVALSAPVGGASGAAAAVSPAVAMGFVTSLQRANLPNQSLVHLVLGREGIGPAMPAPLGGWHNVVLSPEDSAHPHAPVSILGDDSSTAIVADHAVAAVAAVAGLWTGMDEAPFDSSDAAVGADHYRMLRVYCRRLGTATPTAQLRLQVANIEADLPLPIAPDRRPCEQLQNPAATVARFVEVIRTSHQHLFVVDTRAARFKQVEMGPVEAVVSYLRSLLRAARDAPAVILSRLESTLATAVSRGIQNALYGDRDMSTVEVVTRGLNADGRPAGLDAVSAALDTVSVDLQVYLPAEYVRRPDTGAFWSDVLAGARTLVDGGSHSPRVPVADVGGRPAVVTELTWITPSSDDDFAVSAAAVSYTGSATLAAHDPLLHHHVANVLDADAGETRGLAKVKDDLESWSRRMSRSYCGAIASALAELIEQRRTELTAELRSVEAAREALLQAKQFEPPLRRGARAVGAVVLILLLVLAGTYFGGVVALGAALVGAAISVVSGLIGLLIVGVRRHREEFRRTHRLERRLAELEAALDNIPRLAVGLHTATTLYRQQLAWTPLLRTFLRQPLGEVSAPTINPEMAGLSLLSVGLAEAEPAEADLHGLADEVRERVYVAGWLTGPWEEFLTTAERRRPSGAGDVAARAGELYADEVRDAQSKLAKWSDRLGAPGAVPAVQDTIWPGARRLLLEGRLPTADALFHRVRRHGDDAVLDGSTFLRGLTAAVQGGRPQSFPAGLFAADAVVRAAHDVDDTAVATTGTVLAGAAPLPDGVRRLATRVDGGASLDQLLVVVQTSSAVDGTKLLPVSRQGETASIAALDREGEY